jgi:putative DNA primase/helicase
MLQAIGYSLFGSCRFQKCFLLFGSGSNGKGVMIDLIEALIGEANCSHRSLQALDTNRFAVQHGTSR